MDKRLESREFAGELVKITKFFAGVPDSLLKHLCAALEEALPSKNFWITANEGAAVALSAGYTLATGLPGAVYMQNSGLGNAINPLLSLNDQMVYGLPVLLIVGWRGAPGVSDEPQHKKQGLVTAGLLEACQIPYKALPGDKGPALETLAWAKNALDATSGPVALNRPENKVVCLDGDGSVLMHMGSMTTVGRARPSNMLHIMLNNAAHDSVGGHPTGAEKVDWIGLALACGYEQAASADDPERTKKTVLEFLEAGKCGFLEVKVAQGARMDLGRPGKPPAQMKRDFRHALSQM